MTNKYDIASTMNRIMASPKHQATFAKPQPQFEKTAAKKEEDKEDVDPVKDCVDYCKKLMKDADCGGSAKASGEKCVISCPDSKVVSKCKAYCKKKDIECEVKGPKDPKEKAKKAYETCVIGLAKISEALDNAGLAKESAYALMALDGLVRNASVKSKGKGKPSISDCGMAKDKAKSDKNEKEKDANKKGKVSDKKTKNKKDEDDFVLKSKKAFQEQDGDSDNVYSFKPSWRSGMGDDESWENIVGDLDLEPEDFSELGSQLESELGEDWTPIDDQSSHIARMIEESLDKDKTTQSSKNISELMKMASFLKKSKDKSKSKS